MNYEAAFGTGLDVIVRCRNQGFPIGCLQDDNGSYTDYAEEANSSTVNDVLMYPTTPVSGQDAVIFGHAEQFTKMRINVSTVATGTPTITWQYWNGSGWSSLSGVVDDTTGFTVSGEGEISWTLPGGWAETTLNSQNLYWVRGLFNGGTMTVPPKARWAKLDVTRYLPFQQEREITGDGLDVVAAWVEDTIAIF
jgi:hypothetical protein